MDALRSLTRDEARARAALLAVDRYDIDVDLTDLPTGDALPRRLDGDLLLPTPGAATLRRLRRRGRVGDPQRHARCRRMPSATGGSRWPTSPRDNVAGRRVGAARDRPRRRRCTGRSTPRTGEVYVWTSFEPDEARRAWACFDQPDLKAPHAFTVTAPDALDGAEQQRRRRTSRTVDDGRRWTFADTPPLSTYVPVVNAGPFHELPLRARRPRPGPVLPASRSRRTSTATPTSSSTSPRPGLAFFGEQFGMPFPQRTLRPGVRARHGRRDGELRLRHLVATPSIYRSDPTPAERERARRRSCCTRWRTCGSATSSRCAGGTTCGSTRRSPSGRANWAAAAATEFTDAWAGFLAGGKLAGYRADRAPTSHPIRQAVA